MNEFTGRKPLEIIVPLITFANYVHADILSTRGEKNSKDGC